MKKINLKFLILILFVISIAFFTIGLYPTRNQIQEGSTTFKMETPQLSFGTHWGANGTAICTASDDQYYHEICNDEDGGAIIVWEDRRSGNTDIYAQRIDSSGTVQWTTNGVPICTESNDQYYLDMCSDGVGGAIITWQDSRSGNSDIYAQKVDSSGTVQWAANGTAICTAIGNQGFPQIYSDEDGGVIITWEDPRSGTYGDIYAQKVNSSGTVQWATNGIVICTAIEQQWFPDICSDGVGGAIITWEDYRETTISETDSDIYAQRVDSSGTVQWLANGTAICTASDLQRYPQICSDGAGGMIITWEDERNGLNHVYAQRVDSNGNLQWTVDGVAICTAQNYITNMFLIPHPQICSDEIGGAIITWRDNRSGSYFGVYTQKVDSSGTMQWTINGIPICSGVSVDYPLGPPKVCSDEAGGVIITWVDFRSYPDSDVYAQQVDSTGNVLWTTNGELLCMASGIQGCYEICSDGAGGAIVSWADRRSGTNWDIYAQYIKDIPSNGDGDGAIPFGNYYLLFIIFGILSLIIIINGRISNKSKL